MKFIDIIEISDIYYYTIIAENVYGKSMVSCLMIDIFINVPLAPIITSLTVNNGTQTIEIA